MKLKLFFIILVITLFGIELIAKPTTQEVITHPRYFDGFGAQFQQIVSAVFYAEINGKKYVYTPFKKMHHNYNNDPDFIKKKEWLINFINNFEIINKSHKVRPISHLNEYFEILQSRIKEFENSVSLKKIRAVFKSNKNKANYFNDDYFHIAIHIRRPNSHDNRLEGANTPDDVYLKIIEKLRGIYSSNKILFHIYSQGNKNNFQVFSANDTQFHINDSVETTFASMVFADVLVTSRSSFSYTAAFLSEGTIYYMPFWHPPMPNWKLTNSL